MDRFSKFFCDPFKVLKLLFAVLAGTVIIFYKYIFATLEPDFNVPSELTMLKR